MAKNQSEFHDVAIAQCLSNCHLMSSQVIEPKHGYTLTAQRLSVHYLQIFDLY